MGPWAATVRFRSREEAHSFLSRARETGAHAMMQLDGDAGWTVTVLGEPQALDAALVHASGGSVLRREPAGP